MKIAMPHNNGDINPHFGQSKEFAIFSTEAGEITEKNIVSNENITHNHEGIAGFLKSEGVNVVITGGIGRPMVRALESFGFKVITGASGNVDKVAEDFLNQRLVTKEITICGCEHHHEHGHGHGEKHCHGN